MGVENIQEKKVVCKLICDLLNRDNIKTNKNITLFPLSSLSKSTTVDALSHPTIFALLL